MKNFLKITTLLLLVVTVFFISCSKDDETEGCTDETALNFNNLAVIDDGSCEYLDSSFTIWGNQKIGFWEDPITGVFQVKSCFTDTSTIFLNPDTTFTPADTTFIAEDLTAIPPVLADTIITPADTTITGDTYLLVNSDSTGRYELLIQLINKRNALDFKNGYIVFNAKLHPDAVINDFELFIHGNHLSFGGSNCGPFHLSDPTVISTSTLDTNTFKEISIPIADITKKHLKSMDLVFGIKGTNATPTTPLIMINSIKWISKKED